MTRDSNSTSIPVVILHRDEPQFLMQMMESIQTRTTIAYQIFVVDNDSTLPESRDLLESLTANNVTVIRNPHNRWVLGFNSALKHPRFNHDAPYFVFSDCDILVPELDSAGNCWLSRLVGLMDQTACAGKIGLSLDLSGIADRADLKHIYEQELGYASGPRIGDLIIAPVDTTLAIYRKTLFVLDNFCFIPGHKSLHRPYLYALRTPMEFTGEHLGWRNYGLPRKDHGEKIRCFTRFGGYIDPTTLAAATSYDRFYYQYFGPLWRAFWGSVVAYHWCYYILKRFPRGLNELQMLSRAANKKHTQRS